MTKHSDKLQRQPWMTDDQWAMAILLVAALPAGYHRMRSYGDGVCATVTYHLTTGELVALTKAASTHGLFSNIEALGEDELAIALIPNDFQGIKPVHLDKALQLQTHERYVTI